MVKANPPLDKKGDKLLKDIESRLDAFLTASNGTTLADAQAKLEAAIMALGKHRYAQFGTMDPLPEHR